MTSKIHIRKHRGYWRVSCGSYGIYASTWLAALRWGLERQRIAEITRRRACLYRTAERT